MEIICADCGCIVDRGAIVTPVCCSPQLLLCRPVGAQPGSVGVRQSLR